MLCVARWWERWWAVVRGGGGTTGAHHRRHHAPPERRPYKSTTRLLTTQPTQQTKMPKCQKISTPLRQLAPEVDDELDDYDSKLRQEDGSVVRRGDDVAELQLAPEVDDEAVLQRHRQATSATTIKATIKRAHKKPKTTQKRPTGLVYTGRGLSKCQIDLAKLTGRWRGCMY